MKIRLFFIVAAIPALALAQNSPDVSGSQAAMLARVNAVAEKHAKNLGLTNDAINYCQIDLNFKTNQFPRDGLVPYGVNYNNIKSEWELAQVIAARESYEKIFMMLCLSKVKRELAIN